MARIGVFEYCILFFMLTGSVWCKECTNIPTQQSSHTYRYALQVSKDEAWKEQVYSHFFHLTPTDENTWNDLLPPRRTSLENAEEEEFKWRMFYRSIKENKAVKVNGSNVAQDFLQEVPLHNVRLDANSLHGIAQNTNLEYLLLLEVDNLVYSFRATAGLPNPGKPYGGWEAPDVELRGHFVGHYMSSTAHMWASTHNDTLRDKMMAVVSALAECQKAMGTGYLSAFPSEQFDRFEAVQPVWAPYYTIHKIMAGLLDQYTFAGNDEALNMTVWMADYFYKRVQNVLKQWTIERHWASINEETGGMNDVLYRLYTLSGDQKHLELAHLFDKPCFLGMLAVKADSISGFHANTHIPVVIGSQMRYEVTGDPLYKDIGTFFLEIVNSSHAYATGGTSVSEFWSNPKRLADTLETENEESCTTYNMLKVARHMFRWTKEIEYADYYERALTNGVLSIQRGTDPGTMIYMLPLGAGVSKAASYHGWGTKYKSFWCCYGTGIESFSKLGDSIYFQEKSDNLNLYIIQFISSTFTWDAIGFTLKQAVQPLSSLDPYLRISMEFSTLKAGKSESDEESTVNIRIPSWTSLDNAKAMLNTKQLPLPSSGNFLTVKRKWVSDDNVFLTLPVGLRTESLKDDRPHYQSVEAILFGPYLLAGMTDVGMWDLNIGKASSLSDWIKPVPATYASQLFTFDQGSGNNTLILQYNNKSQIIMGTTPIMGSNEAAHATFRLVDSASSDQKSNSAMDFVGKNVYIELFDRPGMVIAHQGEGKDVIVYKGVDATTGNNATMFKVREGLDGNKNSISLESKTLNDCFLYGGAAGEAVVLRCMSKTTDADFNSAVSYSANTGLSTYHPISFIASGSNRNYLLSPLLHFKDEVYTVYFNVTTST